MTTIYDEVRDERARAHAKHGEKSMEGWPADHPLRLPILVEEVGEVAKAMNEAALSGLPMDHPDVRAEMRAELVQVAAMATAWADALTEGVSR